MAPDDAWWRKRVAAPAGPAVQSSVSHQRVHTPLFPNQQTHGSNPQMSAADVIMHQSTRSLLSQSALVGVSDIMLPSRIHSQKKRSYDEMMPTVDSNTEGDALQTAEKNIKRSKLEETQSSPLAGMYCFQNGIYDPVDNTYVSYDKLLTETGIPTEQQTATSAAVATATPHTSLVPFSVSLLRDDSMQKVKHTKIVFNMTDVDNLLEMRGPLPDIPQVFDFDGKSPFNPQAFVFHHFDRLRHIERDDYENESDVFAESKAFGNFLRAVSDCDLRREVTRVVTEYITKRSQSVAQSDHPMEDEWLKSHSVKRGELYHKTDECRVTRLLLFATRDRRFSFHVSFPRNAITENMAVLAMEQVLRQRAPYRVRSLMADSLRRDLTGDLQSRYDYIMDEKNDNVLFGDLISFEKHFQRYIASSHLEDVTYCTLELILNREFTESESRSDSCAKEEENEHDTCSDEEEEESSDEPDSIEWFPESDWETVFSETHL